MPAASIDKEFLQKELKYFGDGIIHEIQGAFREQETVLLDHLVKPMQAQQQQTQQLQQMQIEQMKAQQLQTQQLQQMHAQQMHAQEFQTLQLQQMQAQYMQAQKLQAQMQGHIECLMQSVEAGKLESCTTSDGKYDVRCLPKKYGKIASNYVNDCEAAGCSGCGPGLGFTKLLGTQAPCLRNTALKVEQVTPGQPSARKEFTELCVTDPGVDVLLGANETSADCSQRQALENMAGEIGQQLGITAAEVMTAYDLFHFSDVDRSGKLSVQELKPLLEKMTGAIISDLEFMRVVESFDKDNDRELSFEEFLFCYCNTSPKKIEHLSEWVWQKAGRLPADCRTKVSGVRMSSVKRYLSKEIKEMGACKTLPAIFMLFFVFVLFIEGHGGTLVINSTDEAYKYDIEENANFAFSGITPFESGRIGHKNIYDVNTFADFWSWFDLGLVPLLFPETWDLSEMRANVAARCQTPGDALVTAGEPWTSNFSLASEAHRSTSFSNDLGRLCAELGPLPVPPPEFFRKPPYLFFNSIVAGLRMRQEQVKFRDCGLHSLEHRVFDSACMEDPGHWILPDLDQAMGMDPSRVDQPGAETQYLLSQTSQTGIRQQLRELEDKAWLSQRTSKVELLYTTYNAHKRLFTSLYIYIFVNRAGHMHKVIKPISLWMNPYESIGSYAVDISFVVMVLYLFFNEGQEIMRSCCKKGLKTGCLNYFSSFKNVVDWMSIIYSFVIFGMWAQYVGTVQQLKLSLEQASTSQPGSWANPSDRASYFDLVDELNTESLSFQTVCAFYPFMIGARFFSAFSGQPRLALVTDTLIAAATDVLHFGVVLMCLVLIYSVSALILFGRDVDGFENLGRSFMSVCRGLLGDIDYDSLTRIGRPVAGGWFLTFMILLQLLMLNMLLAIVFDVYSEVKGAVAADAETFWTQSYEIFYRWNEWRRGRRLDFNAILDILEEEDETAFLTETSFRQIVKGLPKSQAEQILLAADDMDGQDGVMDRDSSDVLLRSVNMRAQQLQLMVRSLVSKA